MARLLVIAIVLVTLLAGCGRRPRENVQPPHPGVPAGASDVQGIYRTIHQALLQLRGNGSFVLIVPEEPGPSGGTYTLTDGLLSVRTDTCGDIVGEYRVTVGGEPKPDKATLHFTPVRDDCETRKRHLTLTPFVYAVS